MSCAGTSACGITSGRSYRNKRLPAIWRRAEVVIGTDSYRQRWSSTRNFLTAHAKPPRCPVMRPRKSPRRALLQTDFSGSVTTAFVVQPHSHVQAGTQSPHTISYLYALRAVCRLPGWRRCPAGNDPEHTPTSYARTWFFVDDRCTRPLGNSPSALWGGDGLGRYWTVNTSRTPDEERELDFLTQAFSGGFCVGGYLMTDRRPAAFEVLYEPTLAGPRSVEPLAVGATRFWGCPNLIDRLVFGLDDSLFARILRSDKWAGTPEDLFNLVRASCLGQPRDLPIREAIDWVHASIYTTIKTMKFSHMAPVCGARSKLRLLQPTESSVGSVTRVSMRPLGKEGCSMSTVTDDELRGIRTRLRELPPADWVTAMIEHYRRTGSYRSEDLRRLLGDPNRSVEVGPDASLASFFSHRAGS